MFSQTAESISGAEDIPVPRLERLANVLTHLAALGGSAISATPGLTAELLKIWAGTSSVEPQPGDWRFRNPAWGSNPLYRRVAQSYLAWADAVTRLPEAIDGQDWRAVEQARFLLGILTTAFAPTNFFLGNPAAIERAFETGGQSILTGLKSYLHDLVHNRGMPAQVDLEPFRVGENMAATPGAVVFRNEICELLQYRPTTPSVRSQPMLVIPPPIGRYYFLDLRPKRSFVEYAVSRGLPVFMISWRNARPEGRDWDMDTYGAALIEALDAAHQICGSPDANVLGFCAGGILLSTVLNHLAAHRDRRIGAVSLAVTLLDFDMPAAIGTFSPGTIISVAQSRSAKKGILPAQDLGAVFTWLRPNDLVWNYWVNNYLLGQKPPAIDLMAWNADGTNLPAALHRQFLEIFGKT